MTSRSFRPTQLYRCVLVFVLLAPVCLTDSQYLSHPAFVPHQPTVAEKEPSLGSLPLPVKAAFSADLGQDDAAHHMTPTGDGGCRANNQAAGLTATLSASGMGVRAASHTWSLSLSGWGRDNDLRPLTGDAQGSAAANRLEYAHGALTEWYVNGPLGLQQGWTLPVPPSGTGSGPLTLSLTQGGTLHGHVSASGSTGLALTDATGVERLRYGVPAGLRRYGARAASLV